MKGVAVSELNGLRELLGAPVQDNAFKIGNLFGGDGYVCFCFFCYRTT